MIEYTGFPYKTNPYKHQHDCFMLSRDLVSYALFMEMGCGKSKVVIDTAAHLWLTKKVRSVIIIAPKGVYRNWAINEIPTHMPECVKYQMAVWNSGARKEERDALEQLLRCPDDVLRVLIVNIESVISEKAVEYILQFLASSKPIFGIVDESTTIKNPKAKRTKAMLRLARHFNFRRILTGNPIPNGPLDLWSQAAFLGSNLLGHESYYAFRNAYAVMQPRTFGNRSFQQVVGFRDLDRLQRRMREFSFIVKKADCLDLPPKIYQGIEVRMSDEQEALYDQMHRNALILLEGLGAQVTANIVLTQMMRLHQIACGFVKPDGMDPVPIQKVPMLDELMELTEEITGKIVIWATYRYNIKQITAHLKEKYGDESTVSYFGDTTDDERILAIQRFQNDPKCLYFVGNPDAAGRGLTLTAANTVIYYSNTYDSDKREQSEDRAHRIGTTKAVNYIDFIVPGTVCNKILQALKHKKKMTQEFVASNWKWLLER